MDENESSVLDQQPIDQPLDSSIVQEPTTEQTLENPAPLDGMTAEAAPAEQPQTEGVIATEAPPADAPPAEASPMEAAPDAAPAAAPLQSVYLVTSTHPSAKAVAQQLFTEQNWDLPQAAAELQDPSPHLRITGVPAAHAQLLAEQLFLQGIPARLELQVSADTSAIDFVLVTLGEVPGYTVQQVFGTVTAQQSLARRFFREQEAEMILGRELQRWKQAPKRGLPPANAEKVFRQLFQDLESQARALGANAVLGLQLSAFTEIPSLDSASEQMRIMAYGSAALLEKMPVLG